MNTRKEIATISYNTPEFLRNKLNELHRNRVISDWILMWHDAEQDEKKRHAHVWVKPNKTLDTMELQDYFKEIDLQNPKKPLGVIDFRASKIDDWILYTQHYGPYLASKGESREFCYTKEDFEYCDEYSFDDYYYHAFKGSDWAKRYQILQQLCDGRINKADMIKNGTVPLSLAPSLRAFEYLEKKAGGLDRGDKSNHEELAEMFNQELHEVAEEKIKMEALDENLNKISSYEKQIEKLKKQVDEKLRERYNRGWNGELSDKDNLSNGTIG